MIWLLPKYEGRVLKQNQNLGSDLFLTFADFIAAEPGSRKVFEVMTSYDAHEKDETI
jgi:hypothetical protein